jgi:hypothetical protein
MLEAGSVLAVSHHSPPNTPEAFRHFGRSPAHSLVNLPKGGRIESVLGYEPRNGTDSGSNPRSNEKT